MQGKKDLISKMLYQVHIDDLVFGSFSANISSLILKLEN
jgi:hypothetical protein